MLERKVHLAAEPLQQPHDGASGLREQSVVEAGDEEGDAHAGYRPATGGETCTSRTSNPVSDSLGLTAIFAALPLICLFVLLGGFKIKAQWTALIALGVSLLVALIVYGMPFGQTALSASEGAAFGIFPIMWIVVTAIWVYNMTVATLSPTLLAAANSSGGVLGKMISPQNLAIGAVAVGLAGNEGTCSVRCWAGASC
ncbi:MAG TPA: L-lactate permease [Thermoleophilaceae bacterium]|nr:L-lactate permease [Thermoleophilaceae bacterium]